VALLKPTEQRRSDTRRSLSSSLFVRPQIPFSKETSIPPHDADREARAHKCFESVVEAAVHGGEHHTRGEWDEQVIARYDAVSVVVQRAKSTVRIRHYDPVLQPRAADALMTYRKLPRKAAARREWDRFVICVAG
jgi:hypothetical protein